MVWPYLQVYQMTSCVALIGFRRFSASCPSKNYSREETHLLCWGEPPLCYGRSRSSCLGCWSRTLADHREQGRSLATYIACSLINIYTPPVRSLIWEDTSGGRWWLILLSRTTKSSTTSLSSRHPGRLIEMSSPLVDFTLKSRDAIVCKLFQTSWN